MKKDYRADIIKELLCSIEGGIDCNFNTDIFIIKNL